ncbi:NAD(P)-binding Rossmann-like domain-containing protein [Stigmatella aurantiaca]|uniref:NAD(P)-binding Rossmann-like domain-containing protein n=1 Tax=Stigmatella aurantiaca TaxID=41 RepID=A0A1H7TWR9_STIAU|nr:NAD(P)/FAD-dependent oxidoreductase [Stigmatella aurantiaca]SEL88984.1 NAD(P)-binding Rossmann-like domain-containing protein [Stigmatella aurantiaca]
MELTRRELIAAFLGSAVAAGACQRSRPRASVPGALVDRAMETGHRLRGGPLPRAEGAEPVEVLIVGSGIAGLSAAWRLAAAGVKDVRVVELEDEAGGTSRSGKNAVSAFPWGAHYLPAPLTEQGAVLRLLRELGVVSGMDAEGYPVFPEELLIREPEERLFYKGAWYEGLYLRAGASGADLAELARFEARMNTFAAARDAKGRKAFAVPTALSSDDAEWTALDAVTMAQWLEAEGFRSPRLKWLVDYACRDDYGTTAEGVSAWAGIWYFAARQDGRGERSEGFLSWPEGNGRLVRHLLGAVAPRQVERQVLVHTVEPGVDGCRVEALEAGTGKPRAFQARQVVFAGPRFVAAHVVAPWRQRRPEWMGAFAYGPWVVANLTLSSPPQSHGFPLAWDNVFYESRSLGYVAATHQMLRQDDSGPTVLTWYLPLAGLDVKAERERVLAAGYADWEGLVMADMLPAHPGIAAQAQRLEVMRWGHAMIRPTPGFMWGPTRFAAQESLGRTLHFAHTDLGGMALFEEANWFGVKAAERVLAELGRPQASWL